MNTKLNIIYEDSNLVVVNKECNQEIFFDDMIPLNNLSKEVSGAIIFLKNIESQKDFNIRCSYLGIVDGYMEINASKCCKLINRKEKCSIIELSSFFNDNTLREYLMNINHPIIGDYKYKSNKNPIRRICLHLYKIEIKSKLNRQIVYSNIPDSFKIFL